MRDPSGEILGSRIFEDDAICAGVWPGVVLKFAAERGIGNNYTDIALRHTCLFSIVSGNLSWHQKLRWDVLSD